MTLDNRVNVIQMRHVVWLLAGQVMPVRLQSVKAGRWYRHKPSYITAMMTWSVPQHQHLCFYHDQL